MATVTFTLVGNLADFGADPRAGVRVRIVGTPRIKVDDGTIYSDQPETVTTDSTGAFTADLISTPGLWYRVSTPFVRAVNPVHVAAYIPDPDDPTTGAAFAAGVTVDLADVMDEDPTPGYDGVFLGGGGGVTDHAALTGRSTADGHPISAITGLQTALDAAATDSDLTAHAADTTAVHGITDTAALVVTTDPRLTDARTEAHTYSVGGSVSVTAGTHRIYVEADYVIDSVRASVGTAPTGATLIVDVNKNGATVFTTQSNRPQITAGTFTDVSGPIEVTALASGDYLTVDVDQIGTTVAGADLTVTIRLRRA